MEKTNKGNYEVGNKFKNVINNAIFEIIKKKVKEVK